MIGSMLWASWFLHLSCWRLSLFTFRLSFNDWRFITISRLCLLMYCGSTSDLVKCIVAYCFWDELTQESGLLSIVLSDTGTNTGWWATRNIGGKNLRMNGTVAMGTRIPASEKMNWSWIWTQLSWLQHSIEQRKKSMVSDRLIRSHFSMTKEDWSQNLTTSGLNLSTTFISKKLFNALPQGMYTLHDVFDKLTSWFVFPLPQCHSFANFFLLCSWWLASSTTLPPEMAWGIRRTVCMNASR